MPPSALKHWGRCLHTPLLGLGCYVVVTSLHGGREGIPKDFVEGLDLNPQALAEISMLFYPVTKSWMY